MAAETSSCSALVPKLAPFMQQPGPASSIVELLAPAWWLMDGKPLRQFPLREFWPVLLGYVRSNPVPVACVGALCALVLLSLLLFVTWRFVRCVRVVCCQQESYGDANKVLFSRRLKSGKALLVVLGLLACGAAAWGMISLNRDILPSLNARIDSMQEFPARIVKQVSGLANETAQLSQPLHNISAIIRAADLDGLRSDLSAVTAFLTDAPSPGKLRATLQQLSSALKPQLFDALRQLHGKLNVGSPTSPLAALKGYLDVLSDFDIAPMAPAIRSYSDSTKALFEVITSDWTNTEVQASREFAKLRSSYDQVDLDAWVPYIDQAVATANAINGMRSPATNPFTLVLKSLGEVTSAVDTIRGRHLASITGTVKQFNGLWHNNASRAFESLLDRAAHINHTLLELPRDVESKVRLVNASLADFDKLYSSGKDGLLALPDRITAAGAKLAMPDAAAFITQLKAAEAALTDAPGLDELISKLGALAYALDKTLRDAKNSIEPSLDAFARDPSTRLDLQDTLTFEGPVLARAADAFEHAGVPAFKDVLRGVVKSLEAALAPAQREADAIPGVLKQVSEFDVISTYLPTLQQAEHVYAQFGGNPANLTKPVFEMLDRVSDVLHRELADAQLLVNNVSSSVLQMSDNIHAAAVDSIDRFQSKFLGVPANSSSPRAAAAASASAQASTRAASTLQKAVDGAYFATLGLYALVIALLLLLFVTTLLNCPAGVCAAGFLLNTALVAFAALPLVLTLGMLVMRDTCGSMEAIANKAVITKAGNGSIPAALSNYYLSGGGAEGGAGSFPELMRDINEDYDVAEIKERMQQTVNDMLQGVTKDYKLRPLMTRVVDDATARISSLMGSMDAVLLSLDHDAVVGVYQQGKSFFCCGLVKQAYVQWAASLMVLALAWVALQCALSVLQRLDTLSESCCRFRRYRSGDYGSEPGRRPILGLPPHKPLQSTDSAGSETVAVISLGGALTDKPKAEQSGDGGELPKSTPLPGPLSVSSAPPAAQRMTQRRLYAVPPASQGSSDGGSSSASAQLDQGSQPHQLQRLRVATPRSPLQSSSTLYPVVTPAVVPSSPTVEQWQGTPSGMPGRGLVRSPAGRI